ncbi:hypothetical protein CDV36_015570 [Fusarium kuroshium]|uniref:Uncharacterized protein n=1 Tax=Fusarium kuroshium TaxID=2010991 RepID=A0A3M2R9E4_9HYPO|nr:hypothetical protein CDV36_015570 [Fusarium kuroshium]
MSESTKRPRQADDAPERPPKRRRDTEPDPETDPESEHSHSSSPGPAKKVTVRPGKNASVPLSKERVKAARSFFQDSRPPVRLEDLYKFVGPIAPPLSDTWTQQDEDEMLAEWDASPEEVACASIKGDGPTTTMWKVCLRTFRCSPLGMISPLMGLRYQTMPGPSQPGIWSREFCNRLTALIPYSIWHGRPKRLAMALQYAVICRTDDRRPWMLQSSCPALTRLRQFMDDVEDSELSQSIHHMHKRSRSLATEAGQQISTLSDLFIFINRTVRGWTFERVPEPVTSEKGFEVYSVTIPDLKVVVAAIDSCMSDTVDEAYQVFKVAKGNRAEIPKGSQVRQFYERAALHQLRRITIAHRDQDEDEGEGQGEGDEMAGPQPDPEPEAELEDQFSSDQVPDDESESESDSSSDSGSYPEVEVESGSDHEPSGMGADDGFVLEDDNEAVNDKVDDDGRVQVSPSRQSTAPLVNTPSMTPMASHVVQDVAKMVNDILKKEREEMKSFFESSLESYLKSCQERMGLEMQQRMNELQKRYEAEIKALKEALKKEMTTRTKGNESRGLDDQIQPAGNSLADDGTT